MNYINYTNTSVDIFYQMIFLIKLKESRIIDWRNYFLEDSGLIDH